MGLLAADIADADAVFAEVDKGQVLPADLRFGQVWARASRSIVWLVEVGVYNSVIASHVN
jgi:hypothetical protein